MFKKNILCLKIIITFLLSQQALADSLMPSSGAYQANQHQIDFNSSEHQLMLATGLALSVTTFSVLGETTQWSRSTKMIVSTVCTLAAGAGFEASRGFNEGRYKSLAFGAGLGGVIIPWTFEF